MRKLLICTLVLVLMLSSLIFTAVGCGSGNDNAGDTSSIAQSTNSENKQPEQSSTEQVKPPQSEDDKPDDSSSEQVKPPQSDEPQGGKELPGGLVDGGNFESKH